MGSAPLIGRDRELRLATDLLDIVAPGRATVLLVEGPAGSGRTRMLQEIAEMARRRGMTVHDEGHGAGSIPDGATVVFCCDRPLRIDASTWDAVDRVAESVAVLVVVATRRGAGPVPLERLTSPVVHRLPLEPLGAGEAVLLAGTLLGAPPGPGLLELLPVAAGRPGLVEQLIDGADERRASGRLPRRTEAWVCGQLATISPQARHLLQAATTLRSPFPLLQLTRLLGVSPVTVVPAVAEAIESGLLAADGETVSFTHERVREIVVASLPQPVAAALRSVQRAVDWSVLSPREREVATLAGRAMTNVQIAHRVGRSPHTVNYHLRQIFQKLGIASRVELAALLNEGSGPSLS